MVWRHQEVVSKPDYILYTKQCMLFNVVARYTNHNFDYFMVLGYLLRHPLQ